MTEKHGGHVLSPCFFFVYGTLLLRESSILCKVFKPVYFKMRWTLLDFSSRCHSTTTVHINRDVITCVRICACQNAEGLSYSYPNPVISEIMGNFGSGS